MIENMDTRLNIILILVIIGTMINVVCTLLLIWANIIEIRIMRQAYAETVTKTKLKTIARLRKLGNHPYF